MKLFPQFLLTLAFIFTGLATNAAAGTPDYGALSQDFLLAVRTDMPADSFLSLLATASKDSLHLQLCDDSRRKAFWINIYNAVTQMALKKAPEAYQNRDAFFKTDLISIAGTPLSLDLIEHGILRRSKNKLSYGYLNKMMAGSFEKTFRVDKLDYRIHFALNCGARSCPPIAYYDAGKIDAQLDEAMTGHLKTESDYSQQNNEVAVTAFLGWFRADFGGKKGIRNLLRNAGVIPQNAKPDIVFKPYNWEVYLDNYRE